MSIQVGEILRIVATLVWTDGNIMQNVFNAVISGTGGPYDESDIVDDAVTWCNDMFDHLGTSIVNTVDGSQVQVYLYDSVDDDWDEVGADTWPFNPTGTADQLARGVAALINAKTSDPDVSGKKYVGGLNEEMITDGLWTSAALVLLALYADQWLEPFVGGTSGADWVPGVWSVVDTVFRFATTDHIIPAVPAYQRRRKRGVGV